MKLLVVGAAGQLGSTFAATTGHDVLALTRADVDVTDHDAVLAVVERVRPRLLGGQIQCHGPHLQRGQSGPIVV